jgi:hypothetical protein
VPRLTCSVLTASGWRTATTSVRTLWGSAARTFLAAHDGTVAYCRLLGTAGRLTPACSALSPEALGWLPQSTSRHHVRSVPAAATWVASTAGPALCWAPARNDRGGCQVDTAFGWRSVPLPKKADPGIAATSAFVTDRGGRVSWCRVTTHAKKLACITLSTGGKSWGTGRSAHLAPALRRGAVENRAWVSTSAGPALCGRTGTVRVQRVGCQQLSDDGWRFTGSQRTPWGLPGYRAFVPAGAGVAYCRTLAVKRGTAVACTPMSRQEWGATRTSHRLHLVLPDPF